ncbi:nucleotidyltransferase family protein [Bradyrhizobium sp. OK095]|uniref:nucleotidyltransferase domain-containing protein n=1 Tax=Bradyrhizobium sp. OK095 TaxID=1882760 RepID=UPI0008C1864F|nr:nucleotidyltransferase family protein [Bradyrhizobium sp. OK095]SEN77010.1 Uncharacterised nucleotidyltransferase [Bradyrhizobium sp. OK095]
MMRMVLSPPQRAAFALALACSRSPYRDGSAEALERTARDVTDWQMVLRVIRRHRIVGLAHHALSRSPAAVPDFVRQQLLVRAGAVARTNLMLTSEAIRLDEAFRDAGIEVGFLKGPALSMQLFGDVGRRHSRDLDLLVDLPDVAAAVALLERAGYRSAGNFDADSIAGWIPLLNQWEFRHDRNGSLIELHWRLCPNESLADPLAAAATWSRVDLGGGRTVRALTGDSLAGYLCLHGSLHAWSRLKWLADIDAAIEGDAGAPQRLFALAGQVGLERSAGQALWLAAELLDMPLDPGTRRMLTQDPAICRLGKVALDAMTAGGGEIELENTALGMTRVRLSHFSLGRGWRHWRMQARTLLASSDDLKQVRLPQWLGFIYPLVRPVFWACRRLAGFAIARNRLAPRHHGRPQE